MGDIPRVNPNRGVPNPEAPRLEEQPIPGRTGQPNTNANTRDAPPPRMEAADRTRPADPVKLAMDYFGNPKSPIDEAKGKIPTQDQIYQLASEYDRSATNGRSADLEPPKATHYVYDKTTDTMVKQTSRSQSATTVPATLKYEPTEVVVALFNAEDLSKIDLSALAKITEDVPLMLRLEHFMTETEWQGRLEFGDVIPQKVSVEGRFIGMNEYHLDKDYREEEDQDIHQALRARFDMPQLATTEEPAPVRTEEAEVLETVVETEGTAESRGTAQVEQDEELVTTPPTPPVGTEEPVAELTPSEIDQIQNPTAKFDALKNLWTNLNDKNKPKLPPGS
ncbi:hypothetical protein [Yoonia sp. BS5-3]|uniref:Uncharacterized protein n=1 Tax=Yoonia phaeophyticola TaxID=3137369 RepID=A0ABZ2V6X1_9RHOB